MGWFNKNSSRSPQRLTPRIVRFTGEQDGPAERDLKGSFVELFRVEPKVEVAYLARVEHGDGSGIHVTLCLKCYCPRWRIFSGRCLALMNISTSGS